jgi:hypothetical protein
VGLCLCWINGKIDIKRQNSKIYQTKIKIFYVRIVVTIAPAKQYFVHHHLGINIKGNKIMKIEPIKDRLYGDGDDPKKKKKNENFLYGDDDKEKKKVDEKNKEYKKNQLNETVGIDTVV